MVEHEHIILMKDIYGKLGGLATARFKRQRTIVDEKPPLIFLSMNNDDNQFLFIVYAVDLLIICSKLMAHTRM